MGYKPFLKAVPAWEKGTEKEKNVTLGLYRSFESAGEKTVLRVATSGIYRVYLIGEFCYEGPARAAHGYFRVDEVELHPADGLNHLAIEVVNYYVNSFDTLQQPGFIQCELVCGDTVTAATGGDGFLSEGTAHPPQALLDICKQGILALLRLLWYNCGTRKERCNDHRRKNTVLQEKVQSVAGGTGRKTVCQPPDRQPLGNG